MMNKKVKYLLLCSLLLAGFIFIMQSASVSADLLAGGGCGSFAGEGKCRPSCDPYDEVYISNSGSSGCLEKETCCIPTKCSNNNIGFGKCRSSGSCNSDVIGIWTSDCTPPSICCVDNLKATGGNMQVVGDIPSDSFLGKEDSAPSYKTTSLVPCSGPDCSLCDIFVLIKNLINLFVELTFALAGVFIVWGAIEIMVAGGDEAKVKAGREKVTTAIYGIVIVLIAWLFIGTVLQILTGSSSVLPWNKIQC